MVGKLPGFFHSYYIIKLGSYLDYLELLLDNVGKLLELIKAASWYGFEATWIFESYSLTWLESYLDYLKLLRDRLGW